MSQQICFVYRGSFGGRAVAYRLHVHALGDMPFDAVKSTTGNKQYMFCVNLNKFLVWMLTSALWRYVNHRAFKELEQCLLYAFARHITGNGRVVALTSNLVYFVNEDNPTFGFFLVVIG